MVVSFSRRAGRRLRGVDDRRRLEQQPLRRRAVGAEGVALGPVGAFGQTFQSIVENGPGGVQLVHGDEVRGVAANDFQQETFVGLGHAAALGGRVQEVHAARLDLQFGVETWHSVLDAPVNGLVGLHSNDQFVRIAVLAVLHGAGDLVEGDFHFDLFFRESFAGRQHEGHAGPARVVDVEPRARERLRLRSLVDDGLVVRVAVVLSDDEVLGGVEFPHGSQNLDFLAADVLGVERQRLLHGH
mmetsp:Transcript_7609/g.23508  ORF Transcript_7609/g.23508 Transcript_7609/m.23508 type:complete len:242 (-) Transcript_7609:1230-1955(-)